MGKSCIDPVDSQLQFLTTLLTCQNAVHFRISFIAFFLIIICFVINKDGSSCLIILKYILKTSRIKTSLLGPTKLLIVLKNILSAKSDSIPGILVIIIEKTYYKNL